MAWTNKETKSSGVGFGDPVPGIERPEKKSWTIHGPDGSIAHVGNDAHTQTDQVPKQHAETPEKPSGEKKEK